MIMDASNPLRVLIFGKDARTDAMYVACKGSRHQPAVSLRTQFKSPRLSTIDTRKEFVSVGSLTDWPDMEKFVRTVQPNLAIIGPEEPLAIGLVDKLEDLGIPTFGPCQAAARIETSKAWARK